MNVEKSLDNRIFLMHLVSKLYVNKHKISADEYIALCEKTGLNNYICECTSVFDGLPNKELLKEAEAYINEQIQD